MATHSSILAWRVPWTEGLVGYKPQGQTELDTTEATKQQQHSILGTTKIKALVKSISLR